ncbi:M48 family metalloprotease [Spirulina major]|uniref:M48 family metalloprotease n=1 Tax=Spirulina major TaxID=270636 RepID=UPI0009337EB3|nr:M48 family metalloprotease [Spirulina major]
MTSPAETSFQAGQAAFQAKNYPAAIAHFEAVVRDELDPAMLTQAYQGLIVAYYNGDRARDALDLCKRLSQDPDTYPWAAKTLADLTRRIRNANAAAFIPPQQQRPQTPPPEPSTPPQAKRPLPVAYDNAPEATPAVFISGREWRNAERASQWKRLKQPRRWKFWLRLGGSAIAFYLLLRVSILASLGLIKTAILTLRLPGIAPPLWLDAEPQRLILAVLLLCLILSPWALDLLLARLAKQQPYALYQLAATFPESAKVLQRLTRHAKIPMPTLKLLPIGAPLTFTYGNLPRTSRLVISEGLLAAVEDEELAALLTTQIAAIAHRDVSILSAVITLLHVPFLLYLGSATAGERGRDWLQNQTKIPDRIRAILAASVAGVGGICAAVAYGYYWLWRVPLLYFSRQRQYYGDRFAAEFTGNPNALSRGLLKVAIATARHIEQRGSTLWLMESVDLLLPIGHRQALSLGSLPDKTPFAEVLTWECTNPYRHWLALMNSHPLMGDRLYLLNRYANHWQLPPEIDLPTLIPPPKTPLQLLEQLANSYKALPILQSAVISGLFFGVVLRGSFWFIGAAADVLSYWFPLWRLIWLANAQPFLDGCILIAFSLSLMVWINGYFPDIRVTPSRANPRIEDLLRDPNAVPPQSEGVKLTGELIGRRGLKNWLAQDLMLKTTSGSIKLHFFTKAGPLGNLFPKPTRPEQLIGQKVTVLGWLRRGSTLWIDVDVIRPRQGEGTRSGYPVWITALAILAALWGSWLIWQA